MTPFFPGKPGHVAPRGRLVSHAAVLIHELESRLRMPNEHMVHLATLLDHGTRVGTVRGATGILEIAVAMTHVADWRYGAASLDRLRACVEALAEHGEHGDGGERLVALEARCARQTAELAAVQTRSEKRLRAREGDLATESIGSAEEHAAQQAAQAAQAAESTGNAEEHAAQEAAQAAQAAQRLAALEAKCARQTSEMAALQSRCDRHVRELSALRSATDKQRREREAADAAACVSEDRHARLRNTLERAERRAQQAQAQERLAEQRAAALRVELEACELELAKAHAKAAVHVPAAECACARLSEAAVRVWYMSGGTSDAPAEAEVSDAENALSKQLMAVRDLTQRLIVDVKHADAELATASSCLELAGELVSFAGAARGNALSETARRMAVQFLDAAKGADECGRKRALRVMGVTLGLARREMDGPPLTVDESVVLGAVAAVLHRRCDEELLCVCDVVDPLEVLREWRREAEAGSLEAAHAMLLVQGGKLHPQAYLMGARSVLLKTKQRVQHFRKGSFIENAEVDEEPALPMARVLAYRGARALAYA
jgi:hypothetical protein